MGASAPWRTDWVRVQVPATSANLGPGYDSFALALSLFDQVEARASDRPGLRIQVQGEGAGSVPTTAEHLVAQAMFAAFDLLGARPEGLDLLCRNQIPHGRGLGSSAAAIVAGVLLARALHEQGAEGLPAPAVLELAHRIEGHPDNVAGCLGGGFTISWLDADPGAAVRVGALSLPVVAPLVPVVCVPALQVPTAKARGVLPTQVPHRDAAVNVSRGALLVAALCTNPARPDLLLAATQDLLHQPYREPVFPDSARLMAALRAQGIAATISGAGPSVLALTDPGSAERVADLSGPDFTTYVLDVAASGATVQVRPEP